MPYQDIQKGIEEAKRKALEIQQGINALTPPTVPASLNSQVIQNNSTATLPTPTPDTTPYSAITTGAISYMLPNGASYDVKTGQVTPAPTPTTPTTPTTPADTTWSDKAKSYINSLLGLQAQDTGQEAYSQQQLEQSGAIALEAKQRQLTARANALNTESMALQNQTIAGGAIENRLQLESEGRGRTVGGLAPLTTSALRQNQIQRADITSKVLALQSEYAMNAGDLVTAKETAQRAVDLKYKPIEEGINNFTKQLATIMPFLNAEEKARADALTLQNEAKKTELATKKAQQTALVNDANQAKDSLSASKALALDPSDPQFNAKLAEIQRTLKIKDENVWGNPYTLGGDLVQRNSVTGEIRTAVNVPKSPTTPIVKFTPTQKNKGAVNAGLDLETFDVLSDDVKNYYVNLSSTAAQSLKDTIAEVANGERNPQEVKDYIKNRGVSSAVASYLNDLVDDVTPQDNGGGFWSNTWSSIKGLFQ